MAEPLVQHRRRLTLGHVVVPLGMALFVLLSAIYLRTVDLRAEADRQHSQTLSVSAVLSARLSEHVASRLNAAALLHPVRTPDGALDRTEFAASAARMLELFTDVQAINFADPDGIIRIVSPLEGNEAALGLNLRALDLPSRTLAASAATGILQITPPITLAQGGKGFAGYLPLRDTDAEFGYLNIVFRTDALIEPLLSERIVAAYRVRILDEDATVYTSSDAPPLAQRSVTTEVPIANRVWRIEIAPVVATGGAAFLFGGVVLPFGIVGALVVAALGYVAVSRQVSLIDSRARLGQFARASSDWFWETDDRHRLSWLSDGFERSLGVPREDFLGRDRAHMAASGEVAGTPPDLFFDPAQQKPFRDLTYPVTVDGTTKWIRTSGVPVFDQDGTFCGYRGTASNVTQEIETRAKADRAQWLLQAAVENLDEQFSVWGADDRLVIANTRFRDFFADALAGLPQDPTYSRFLRRLIEQGCLSPAPQDVEQYLAQAQDRLRSDRSEAEQAFANGRIFRVRTARLENGGAVVTAIDITAERRNEAARRASEERYELASRQIAIWDWDLVRDKLYISPQFAARLGYTADEFARITARSVADIIHPDDVESYRSALSRHLADPESAFSHEHRFRTRSGDYRWFVARGQAVTDAAGKVVRSTGVLTDITDRVALERRLHQAQKMESIGQLTGGLAHDFNNLLAVVQGHAEALLERDRPNDKRIAAIMRAAQRGSQLTQRLLAVARRQPLQPVSIDCRDVAAGVVDLLRQTLGDQLRLTNDLPRDLWPASADPAQVENALINLIFNARDAMPDGGEVRITARNETLRDGEAQEIGDLRPGQYVVLSVSDTGKGMSAEVLGRAFDPFFTTKGGGKGSGLGLSMIYGFARQSGGSATIQSAPGEGTTVNLFLPRAKVRPGPAPKAGGTVTAQRGKGQRILVVEDDAELLGVVNAMLVDLGYEVESASSLAAARSLLGQSKGFDLVLSDVVLPRPGGGADYATVLSAEHPDMRMVFMSGYPANMTPEGGTWNLDAPLLVKPFGKAQLGALLAARLSASGG